MLPLLPPAPISGRSLALMLLAGDETLRAWLEERLNPPEIGPDRDPLFDTREIISKTL